LQFKLKQVARTLVIEILLRLRQLTETMPSSIHLVATLLLQLGPINRKKIKDIDQPDVIITRCTGQRRLFSLKPSTRHAAFPEPHFNELTDHAKLSMIFGSVLRFISRHGSPNPGNKSVTRRKDVSPHWMRTRWAGANARRPTTRIACGIVDPCLSSEEREYESMDAHARVASCEMDFGSLPTDVLRLILPIQGKAACIAAQVCSSWRSHIKSQLLGYDIGGQSLPNWCRRWQVADLSEANFAFGTLCRIQPQLLQQADVYNSSGQVLGNRDLSFQDVINHVQLGQAIEPTVFQFFTSQSLAGDSICWNNVALMEHSFGDDLDRMESWWMLVEGRLNTKEHGLSILQTLRFGSTWQHLYNHASRLSPEVFLHASFSRRATRPRHFLRPFSGLLSLFVSQWAVQRCDR
jgi:hypothetical protein